MNNIKELIKNREYQKALDSIILLSRSETSQNKLLNLSKTLPTIPREEYTKKGYIVKRVAFLSGYTSQFISKLFQIFMLQNNIYIEIFECEYGLYEQAILSRDENLLNFKPDIIYFCVGSDHISIADIESEKKRWPNLWTKAHEYFQCDIIQNTFEVPVFEALGNFALKEKNSSLRKIMELNIELADNAPIFVHFNNIDFLSGHFGRQTWRDLKMFDIAKIPVREIYLKHYVKNLSQISLAILGKSKKCLVLDLDNTLWGGVIGDDGLSGISIGEDSGPGEAFKRFQDYILSLKKRGVILAVCSKNEESIAKEVFEKKDEMVLKLDDISCFMANWDPKHINIQKIAQTLNIGLDSMVFVDDNPAEREIVKQNIPEVKVIDLPQDPSLYTQALYESGLFEIVSLTQEDLNKTRQYQENTKREKLKNQVGDYNDYLDSLEMNAQISPFDKISLPRITQLINKTNQFNLTTQRYTESQVEIFKESDKYLSLYVRLKDKFGDNGLISVLIAEINGNILEIDSWLMSCRVLKRNVEHLLMQEVLKFCIKEKIIKIIGTYKPTAKNMLVKSHFSDLGFKKTQESDDGLTYWEFDLTSKLTLDQFLNENFFINLINKTRP